MNKRRIFRLSTLFLGASLLALSLSACESRKNTRGNFPDPERVIEIRPGEQSREEVAEILGSPSSVTPFGSDTWYYISQRIETFAFFAPKVMERQIVVVSFDKKGVVSKIDTLGLEKARAIIPVSRKTPTHGNTMTILEQLVGNLGRFKNSNKKSADSEEQ